MNEKINCLFKRRAILAKANMGIVDDNEETVIVLKQDGLYQAFGSDRAAYAGINKKLRKLDRKIKHKLFWMDLQSRVDKYILGN